MDEHIIALLNNNLRVIIPDFGAFIVRQKEPKVIVFNEFLRYNDGLLIDYIAKAEQIEKEIAEQRITIFAEEATKTLESGKDLQIKGLGMLTRDPSGKINFVSESSHTVKERSRSEREAGRRATKSDVVKGTAGASASDAVKKVSDLKSPESEKTLSKGSENELIRDQDIKKEAPAEGIKEKMAARAADKPEIKEESQPERKAPQQPEPESKEESVKVSKSVAETGTQPVDKAKPETAAKAETGPVTKAKPETAAKAETGPVTKAKPETAAKAETRTGSGSGPKKESEASPETRTHGRSGIDHRSGQRDYAVSSLSSQSARTALHTETAKTPPSRKSRKVGYTNQLLIWIVIILFVNIIILAWFLYRDDIRQIFKKGQETVLVSDTLDIAEPVSSAFEMTEDVSEPVVEEVPAIEEAAPMEVPVTADAQTLAGQPRFYIVAGCFSEEVNADALVRSLRTKGFNAEKFGRIGNLHAVSYTSFNNRADALRELERIRKEEQPDAWMTRF